ncbi:dynamin family protein [Primorskyibacter sp. 2E233]|uniref:dynamin family protein n=1 Tax=Primorskyibacter sp. 2E233 TaxID=3413431 RepID=UPI003BF0BFCF
MTRSDDISDYTEFEQTGALNAFKGLEDLADRLDDLEADLTDISTDADPAIAASVRKLRRQIRDFEPNITMVGQVKAGKTTLVNAMAGWPDLLPADVNPWTSVVTSLHMQPNLKPNERRSSFRFFSNEEWDRLITRGGRVGELANRAGAEDELEKVRKQLDEMREKSQARLGRRFSMLLGQSHDYETFDETLIQRYVCLGDDFWEEADGSFDQGRFADITKSADLWFGQQSLPVGLCIQDTPGVNDTFMIREQITINALRGAKLCVMVLSAQQALSSVDLGLIRLIANVKSRDIIIFVNRIDELTDPVREMPEIRQSILDTLKKFDGPRDAQIIFGSGFWASHAIANTCHEMGEDSAEALLAWAEAQLDENLIKLAPQEMVWHLSGLPALGDAISERIENGVGARLIERLDAAKSNLRANLVISDAITEVQPDGTRAARLSQSELAARLHDIETNVTTALDARLSQAHTAFLTRIENAHQTFLGRATASLVKHLELYGEEAIWTYDPVGLRMLLRTAYRVFVKSATEAGSDALATTAMHITALYQDCLGQSGRAPTIVAPPLPTASPPIALGQTIALDLRGSWWTRFWRRRRGHQALCNDFANLIYEETSPVVTALRRQNADSYSVAIRAELRDFIASQRALLDGLFDKDKPAAEAPCQIGDTAGQPRIPLHLDEYALTPTPTSHMGSSE